MRVMEDSWRFGLRGMDLGLFGLVMVSVWFWLGLFWFWFFDSVFADWVWCGGFLWVSVRRRVSGACLALFCQSVQDYG